jgi:hypothetical protein
MQRINAVLLINGIINAIYPKIKLDIGYELSENFSLKNINDINLFKQQYPLKYREKLSSPFIY